MVQYRVLDPREYPQAVRLWVSIFGVESEFFTSLLESRSIEDNISVAAVEGDEIVASVHVFVREIRDRDGRPLKVGGIGSVSTLDSHRKQGLSGKLIQLAIEKMAEAGCVWSYLGTGKNNHYARYGYRTVGTRSFRGVLNQTTAPQIGEVRPVDNALLSQMAVLHDNTFGDRPMAMVRSPQNWQSASHYRLTRHGVKLHVVMSEGELTSYLVAQHEPDAVTLIEGAWAPGSETKFRSLVEGVLNEAAAAGATHFVADLPEEFGLGGTFDSACSKWWTVEERSWMALPIADRISWPELGSILLDPRGRRSDLDNF